MASTQFDLIKRGKGSGSNARKYAKSDGSGLWTPADPLASPLFVDATTVGKSVQFDLSGMTGLLTVPWLDDGMDNTKLSVPRCMVHHSANQSTTSGSLFTLHFDTEDWDNDSMHDPATTPNTKITINHAGVYLLGASANFATNSTGYRQIMIRKNGTTVIVLQTQVSTATSPPDIEFSCNIIHSCVATDYFECLVLQTSGGALNLQFVAGRSPYFYATRLSAA